MTPKTRACPAGTWPRVAWVVLSGLAVARSLAGIPTYFRELAGVSVIAAVN